MQWRLIYAIIVAGKSAKFAERAIEKLKLYDPLCDNLLPFEKFYHLHAQGQLVYALKFARTGNYSRISKAITQLVASGIDIKTCTPEELETIHGIGPKTARFFILWTRPDAPYAALDIHILRWLGKMGYSVPAQTPNGKKYAELERVFLKEADDRNLSPRALDFQIWSAATGYNSR